VAKKLTLSVIEKENKKFLEKQRIEFDNGEYYLMLDKHFSPKKITSLLREFNEKILYIREKGIDPSDFDHVSYFWFLTIKYFTDLGETITDELEQQLFIMDQLLDSNYFSQIIGTFNDEQINTLSDYLSRYVTNMNALLNTIAPESVAG